MDVTKNNAAASVVAPAKPTQTTSVAQTVVQPKDVPAQPKAKIDLSTVSVHDLVMELERRTYTIEEAAKILGIGNTMMLRGACRDHKYVASKIWDKLWVLDVADVKVKAAAKADKKGREKELERQVAVATAELTRLRALLGQ
jgi:hypothetical protein